MTSEELIQLRNELDTASDTLNRKIGLFEKDLGILKMGVQVWVTISEGTQLGYIKYQGVWRVCVRFNDNYSPDEPLMVIRPLVNCERGLRYHGYKHIDKLVPEIEKQGKALLIKINRVLSGAGDREDSDE